LEQPAGRGAVVAGLGALLLVAAGAERPLAGAREADDAHVGARPGAFEAGDQLVDRARAERVEPVGAVDGDPGEAVLDLVADIGELGHGRTLRRASMQERVALVTGGARGIGRAIALALAADGRRVVVGGLRMIKATAPGMVERGWGRVVNIGSDAGRVGSSLESVYSAAKGGVIAFTKTLARELARTGVTANTVCPGPTRTPMLAEMEPRLVDALA